MKGIITRRITNDMLLIVKHVIEYSRIMSIRNTFLLVPDVTPITVFCTQHSLCKYFFAADKLEMFKSKFFFLFSMKIKSSRNRLSAVSCIILMAAFATINHIAGDIWNLFHCYFFKSTSHEHHG